MSRPRTPLRLAAVALLLPLAAACASSPLAPNRDLDEQIRRLEQRIVEMQRQAAVNQLAIDELRRQVARLEAATGIAAATPAPARSPAGLPQPRPAEPAAGAVVTPGDTSALPQPRRSPPAAGRPAAQAPAAANRQVSEEQPAGALPDAPVVEQSDLEAPPEIERRNPPPAAGAEPPAAPAASAPPAAGSQPIPPAGQALYDRGYTLYHQGRYLDAETQFQRFLQAHGDTDLADNAQYWIGESRYSRGDYRGALAAFRETVGRYPQGNKVPDALLKAGQALEQLGDREGARASYREVRERFPSSAASVVAEERLRALP